jgi:hypothetical protein
MSPDDLAPLARDVAAARRAICRALATVDPGDALFEALAHLEDCDRAIEAAQREIHDAAE